LLKPVGNPALKGIKFCSTAELLEQAKDRAWLVKLTNSVDQHWQRYSAAKKNLLAMSVCATLKNVVS
jgi:galactose-1-phosphate uridylyltransferase